MKRKDAIIPEVKENVAASAEAAESVQNSAFSENEPVKKAKRINLDEKSKAEITDIVRTALVLLLVTGITVILLAFVNFLTKGPIEQRKKAELDKTVGEMFPGMSYKEINNFEFDAPVKTVYAIVGENDEINGFCVITVPQGFGGDVEMLVGLDTELTVVKVKITEDAETASKSKPVKDKLSQYESKKGPFVFGENGVDAVSSSTVTSKAVLSGVNSATDAAEKYLGFLRQGKEAV